MVTCEHISITNVHGGVSRAIAETEANGGADIIFTSDSDFMDTPYYIILDSFSFNVWTGLIAGELNAL